MQYKKKPVIIEAVQFLHKEEADNPLEFGEMPEWLSKAIDNKVIQPHFKTEDYWYLKIKTLEGTMVASPMDWVIRGVKGEIYPCKPDIFEATYEPVSEGEIFTPHIK